MPFSHFIRQCIIISLVVVTINGCGEKTTSSNYENAVGKKVVEQIRLETKSSMNLLQRLYYEYPRKLEPFIVASVHFDSLINAGYDSLEAAKTSTRKERLINEVFRIGTHSLTPLFNEWIHSDSLKPLFLNLRNDNHQYSESTISTIQKELLLLNTIFQKKLAGNIASSSPPEFWNKVVRVFENQDFVLRKNQNYKAMVCMVMTDTIRKLNLKFHLDTLLLNGKPVPADFEVTREHQAFNLVIKNKDKGEYQWSGRYQYIKANGDWGTSNVSGSFTKDQIIDEFN